MAWFSCCSTVGKVAPSDKVAAQPGSADAQPPKQPWAATPKEEKDHASPEPLSATAVTPPAEDLEAAVDARSSLACENQEMPQAGAETRDIRDTRVSFEMPGGMEAKEEKLTGSQCDYGSSGCDVSDWVSWRSQKSAAASSGKPKLQKRKSTKFQEAYLKEQDLLESEAALKSKKASLNSTNFLVQRVGNMLGARFKLKTTQRPTGEDTGSKPCSERHSAARVHSSGAEPPESLPASPQPALKRRSSQMDFADQNQCIIIFDWDDTLFPTWYIKDELRLRSGDQLQMHPRRDEIEELIDNCELHAIWLLRQAMMLAKVIVVTLAKSPWVEDSCRDFYSSVGEFLQDTGIDIIYAQEGLHIEYDKVGMMADEDIEKHWAAVKGQAIAREVDRFYSQYEAQTWKNIISVGDSNFERLGTLGAVQDYLREHGVDHTEGDAEKASLAVMRMDATGKQITVRAKIFRMMDMPTPEELGVELQMIKRYLPRMVHLDAGCDFDLEALDDEQGMKTIEDTLRSVNVPPEKILSNS